MPENVLEQTAEPQTETVESQGDEQPVEQPQEEEEKPSTEEVEEKPAEETPEEEEEDGLEFDEWVKQYGDIPDSIKSPEDLVKSYMGLLPEMKRTQNDAHRLRQLDEALKAKGLGGVNDLLRDDVISQFKPAPKPVPQGGESIFDTQAAMNHVKKMIDGGNLTDQDSVNTYKAVANMLDSAYGPQFGKSQEVYHQLAQGLNYIFGRVRDMEWNSLDPKMRDRADRAAVDGLMNSGAFKNYEDALRFHLFQNPDTLSQLTEHAKEEGRKSAFRKLKSGSIRRQKSTPTAKPKWNYDRYLLADGNWNTSLMSQELSSDKRVAMLDDYLKENFPEQR